MSTTELDPAAKLAAELKAIRDAQSANGDKMASMERAIDGMQTLQRSIQQQTEAAARAAVEQRAGTVADHSFYSVKGDPGELGPDARQHVRAVDGVAVQLTGCVRQRVLPRSQGVQRSWAWGLLDDPNPRSKEQLRLQRAVTNRSIVRAAMAPPTGTSASEARNWRPFTPALDAEVVDAAKACGPEVAKIFSDSAGIGAEWVPDTYVPDLERDVVVPSGFTGLFPQRILPPGGTKIPNISGHLRVYKHSAPSSDDPANATLSTITTGNNQIDPVHGVVAVQIDRDADEDSILAVLPELREKMIQAIMFARDDSSINGDSAATHQDAIAAWNVRSRLGTSNLGGSNDHRRRWRGLRARAYDLTSMTTDQNLVQTWAGMRTAIAKLSPDNLMIGHGDPSAQNIVVALSWEYFFAKVLDFDEFQSWDKVGAFASDLTGRLGLGQGPGGILPGQVGFVSGFVPVVVGYPITADLATTGLYTGSGSTTGMLVFDRSRFEYCIRQDMRIESAVDIRSNVTNVVARVRDVLREKDAVSSSIKDVHWSFNLTY